MKNLILILSITLLTFSACTEKSSNQYHLSGKIEGLNEQQLVLEFVNFNENKAIDTTSTDANGNYVFEGKVAEPGFYRIASNGKNWMLRLDNEEVVYNTDFDDDLLTKTEVLKSEKAKALELSVKDFGTNNPISVSTQMKIAEAEAIMHEKKISALIVCDEKKFKGILHRYDI